MGISGILVSSKELHSRPLPTKTSAPRQLPERARFPRAPRPEGPLLLATPGRSHRLPDKGRWTRAGHEPHLPKVKQRHSPNPRKEPCPASPGCSGGLRPRSRGALFRARGPGVGAPEGQKGGSWLQNPAPARRLSSAESFPPGCGRGAHTPRPARAAPLCPHQRG